MFAGCRGGVRAGTTVRVSDNKGIGCKSVRRHASPKLGGCNCHKRQPPIRASATSELFLRLLGAASQHVAAGR